jgi:soluble lytic murein transglycosylase
VIAGLGKLAAHYNDAQKMLLIGKTALARDLPMDVYAFPDVGVPNCSPIGPQVDRCIIYAIVRTEAASTSAICRSTVLMPV